MADFLYGRPPRNWDFGIAPTHLFVFVVEDEGKGNALEDDREEVVERDEQRVLPLFRQVDAEHGTLLRVLDERQRKPVLHVALARAEIKRKKT